jgi:hypothetical protein
MGLFDIFKKKSGVDIELLSLEDLLKNAAVDAAYRVAFYKRLLTSELIVLTPDPVLSDGVQTLEQDTSLRIVALDDGRIPVFTSQDRMFDKHVIDKEMRYVAMSGKDLFGVVAGATLLLNPYSNYGKELLPSEIKSLLDGTMFGSAGETITVNSPTKVLLGQPAKIPTEMLAALSRIFARRTDVSAAYLGWIDMRGDKDVPPHYVIGIETNDYSKDLVEEIGFTANQFLGANEFVDLIELNKTDGVGRYLSGTKPFYKR